MKQSIHTIAVLSVILAGATVPAIAQLTPQQAITKMTRGMNIGRCMELPHEGDAQTIQEFYFDDIKQAGFNFVRIPIQWDQHTGANAPYTVDSAWLDRVQQVVDWGLERGLIVIINSHHDRWILEDPNFTADEQARFEAIWAQASYRLRTNSANLFFEIANEPNGLSIGQVDQLNASVISIIRSNNPTRIIVYSGNAWTGVEHMKAAAIPNDPYIMATFHSYDPWTFAGEGTGTWGTAGDRQAVTNRFEEAYVWSQQHNIPVILGEWGTVGWCDPASREVYIATYAEEASRAGIAPCVWHDFGWFGIYYPNNSPSTRWSNVKDIIMANTLPAPTSPIVITGISVQSNIVDLAWNSSPGDTYAVEYSLDLIAWSNLVTGISAVGTNTSVMVRLASSSTGTNEVLAQYQMGSATAQIQDSLNSVSSGPLTAGSGATLFNVNANVTPDYVSQPELQLGFSTPGADLATAVANQTWLTFTLTAGANVIDLDLGSLSFNAARGGAAEPRGFGVYVSTPTTADELVQGPTDLHEQRPAWDPQSIDLTGFSSLQNLTNGQAVTFTIPIYAPNPGNSIEFDDITVKGKSTFSSILAQVGSQEVFFRIRQ